MAKKKKKKKEKFVGFGGLKIDYLGRRWLLLLSGEKWILSSENFSATCLVVGLQASSSKQLD